MRTQWLKEMIYQDLEASGLKPGFICFQAPSWASLHYGSLLLNTRDNYIKEMQAQSSRGPEEEKGPLSGDLVGALRRETMCKLELEAKSAL